MGRLVERDQRLMQVGQARDTVRRLICVTRNEEARGSSCVKHNDTLCVAVAYHRLSQPRSGKILIGKVCRDCLTTLSGHRTIDANVDGDGVPRQSPQRLMTPTWRYAGRSFIIPSAAPKKLGMGRSMEKIFQAQTLDCDMPIPLVDEARHCPIASSGSVILQTPTESVSRIARLRMRAVATSIVRSQRTSIEKSHSSSQALWRIALRVDGIMKEFASSPSLAISFFIAVAITISLACVFGAPVQLMGTLLVLVLFTAIAEGAMRARQNRISELSGRDKKQASFDWLE